MFLNDINLTDQDDGQMKEMKIGKIMVRYLQSGRIERDWLWIRYIELRSRFDQIERSAPLINI